MPYIFTNTTITLSIDILLLTNQEQGVGIQLGGASETIGRSSEVLNATKGSNSSLVSF